MQSIKFHFSITIMIAIRLLQLIAIAIHCVPSLVGRLIVVAASHDVINICRLQRDPRKLDIFHPEPNRDIFLLFPFCISVFLLPE